MKLPRLFPILVLAFSIASISAQETISLPENFDVQGHRGARGLRPENTLPAFEIALDLGVTTLELDMHLTADGVVVVWHDDRIEGDKCGINESSEIDVPDPDSLFNQGDKLLISQLTWEQVQAYRCDRNPDSSRYPEQNNDPTVLAGDDYHIPSLDEVFSFVEDSADSELKTDSQRENAAGILFNIETKRKFDNPKAIGDDFDGENAGAFELAVLEEIAGHQLEDRVAIQSFDHRSLWAVHRENENITLVALTSRVRPVLADLAAQGAVIWSPNFNDLTPSLLEEAHELGLRVIPWTINDAPTMTRLIEMGVDGIITDRPDILLGQTE